MFVKLGCFVAVLLLLSSTSCKSSNREQEEKKAVEQLSSDDWKVREKGVHVLIDVEAKDGGLDKNAQKKLLDLLGKESQTYKGQEVKLQAEGRSVNQISDELDEKYPPQTYGVYIKALANLAASKNVENSLPAIFKLIVDTNYNVSPAVLTLYGTKYLDFFIDKATKGIDREREIAVSVLAIWVNPLEESDEIDIKSIPTLSAPELKKAQGAFLKAISDPDYNVRYIVLSSLGGLIDRPEVRQIVEDIAKRDSEQYIRRKAEHVLKGNK